jgi:hypothetical protein
MTMRALPLAAALIAWAFAIPASAQYASAPPKQTPKAAPAKPAPRVVAPAPVAPPPPPEPKTLLGVRLGSPGGLNGYVMHAVDPQWSVGVSIGGFPLSVEGDKLTLFGLAAEGRYHWRGMAPKGGYVFGQLAYVNGKFSHKDNETEREDANGLYPSVGIGYQTRTTGASWDMGIGAGRPVKIKRKTPNNDDELTIGLAAYLGLGFWLP